MRNEIQVGRYNGVLHKLLGMPEGAPSPTLATDVFPMLALEVDRPEWKFLGGERLCGGRMTDGNVAAQYSHVGLRNPAGSGMLVVVQKILIGFAANGAMYVALRAISTADNIYATYTRDSRWPGLLGSAKIIDHTTAVAQGTPYAYIRGLANTTAQLTDPYVLHPGYDLLVRNAAVNVQVDCSFMWTERGFEPNETR